MPRKALRRTLLNWNLHSDIFMDGVIKRKRGGSIVRSGGLVMQTKGDET
jgi:hypothetical protein